MTGANWCMQLVMCHGTSCNNINRWLSRSGTWCRVLFKYVWANSCQSLARWIRLIHYICSAYILMIFHILMCSWGYTYFLKSVKISAISLDLLTTFGNKNLCKKYKILYRIAWMMFFLSRVGRVVNDIHEGLFCRLKNRYPWWAIHSISHITVYCLVYHWVTSQL